MNCPGLGYLDGLVIVDWQTLRFAFVATTRRQLLARRIREGRCWMKAVVPEGMIGGIRLQSLSLRVVFEDEGESNRPQRA